MVIRETVDSHITITLPEPITVAELYTIMENDGEFELPHTLSVDGAIEYITFPLGGNDVIKITTANGKIEVFTTKDSWWEDHGYRLLTRGWSNILDSYQGDYQPLLEDIAAEIRRITNGGI